MGIREVARRSGVSVATVSRALNDRPDVSAATRPRVREVAEELGYHPNHQARTLVRRRSDTVGLIWDTSRGGLRGCQGICTRRGRVLIIDLALPHGECYQTSTVR